MGSSTAFKAWAHTFDLTRRADVCQHAAGPTLHGCTPADGVAVEGGALTDAVATWATGLNTGMKKCTRKATYQQQQFLSNSLRCLHHICLYNTSGLPPGVPSRNPRHVGRIAVLSFDPCSAHEAVSVLQRLKEVVRGGRAAAMVTMPAGLVGRDCDTLVRRVADAVVCLAPLMDDDPLLQLIAEPQTCVVCGVRTCENSSRSQTQVLRIDAHSQVSSFQRPGKPAIAWAAAGAATAAAQAGD